MSLKYELLFILFLFATYLTVRTVRKKRLYRQSFQTKEGYTVTFQDVLSLSHPLKGKVENSGYDPFQIAPFVVITTFFSVLFSFTRAIDYVVPGDWVSLFYILLFFGVMFYFYFKVTREVNVLLRETLEELYLETPEPFRAYGRYIENWDKFSSSYKELVKEEKTLKKYRHSLEETQLEVELLKESSRKVETKDMKMRRILGLKSSIEHTSQVIIILNKRIEQSITNSIPLHTASLLAQKEDETVITQSKPVPHHIAFLEQIAQDKTLPKELRDDALKTLLSHAAQEAKKREEERIQEAQIELDVAKRFL